MYQSAFLGCGPRAEAYRYVQHGKIGAICDLDKERFNAFGNDFGIEARYTDIHEMLDKERPDLWQIVTPPLLRVKLMTIATQHGVPVAMVEKPIAVQRGDFRQIRELRAPIV